MRQGANVICVTEMNEFVVNEAGIVNTSLGIDGRHPLRVVGSEPLLTIIRPLLTERE